MTVFSHGSARVCIESIHYFMLMPGVDIKYREDYMSREVHAYVYNSLRLVYVIKYSQRTTAEESQIGDIEYT